MRFQCDIKLAAAADGKPPRLSGVLLTYGERAKDRPVVFEAGAVTWPAGGVVLNRQHTRAAPILRFMPVADGDRLLLDAELPDTAAGRDAAAEVRSGLMTGLSIEVLPNRQRYQSGVAHVQAARMTGAALVDDPALAGSSVQVHAAKPRRRRRWL